MFIKIITIITVIILFYGNTLFNGFVHDDIWQITENQNLRSIGNLPKIFSTCIAEEILGTCKNIGFYYRPLQFVSYLFTYQISKDAWAFHLINLLYVFVLGVLVYKFFQYLGESTSKESRSLPRHLRGVRLARRSSAKPNEAGMDSSKVYILLATIFFLVHPINSEVINWIGGVPELLLGIFTIGMLIFYIKFSASGKVGFLIASAILYTLGLLSKETGFFAIGLVVLYEIVFIGIKRGRERLQKYFQAFVFYLVPLSLYLILRAAVLGRIVYKYEGFYSMTFWQQIGNAISLFPQYVLKLFYPLPLSLQHPFIPATAIDGRVVFAVLFLLVNILLLYFAIKKRQKVLVFGFFFFAITLSPVLIFINKLGEFVFSERYLFLPSIGFTLMIFELLSMSLRGSRLVGRRSNPIGLRLLRSARNDKNEPARRGLVGSIVISTRPSVILSEAKNLIRYGLFFLFSLYLITSWYIVAVNRNKDWKDNLSSYLSIVRAYPDNKKASAQAYTILFKLSSKRFAKDNIAFLYPSGWKIDSICHTGGSKAKYRTVPGKATDRISSGDSIVPTKSGLQNDNPCITIKSRDNTFTVEMQLDKKPGYQTVDEYLAKQTVSLGTLINQGPALIPNVDRAYVKIWQDSSPSTSLDSELDSRSSGFSKMQFFLFKKEKVLEIRVWPSDSGYMRDFDEILRSLEIRIL